MQEDARLQAQAREDYKQSMEANDRERQRKVQRKVQEQAENAAIMEQAIALRQKQDQVGGLLPMENSWIGMAVSGLYQWENWSMWTLQLGKRRLPAC